MSTDTTDTTDTTNPSNVPTYVYKLIPSTAAPSSPLPPILPVSSLDHSSGFIHLSTSLQVPGTLKHFFSDEPHVYVLRIFYHPVDKDVKWEDPKAEVCGPRGGEGLFPHLYNGLKLGRNEVESIQRWENDKDGAGWDSALRRAEDWLVY